MKSALESAAPWQYHGDTIPNSRAGTGDFWQNQQTIPHGFSLVSWTLIPEVGDSSSYFWNAQCLHRSSGRSTECKSRASRYTLKENLRVFDTRKCKKQVKVWWDICTMASSFEQVHSAYNLYFFGNSSNLSFLRASIIRRSSPLGGVSNFPMDKARLRKGCVWGRCQTKSFVCSLWWDRGVWAGVGLSFLQAFLIWKDTQRFFKNNLLN